MRISFANITVTYDFKSKEEAEKFRINNLGKGWSFGEIGQFSEELDGYGNMWTIEVRKPFRDYNMGC